MGRGRRHNTTPQRADSKKNRGGYERHDAYYHKAKAAGFVARSVYKLDEIQQRFRILAPGDRVLDLGCAPGAWLQLAAQLVGEKGRVVGIDLNPITVPLPDLVQTLVGDIREVDPQQLITLAGVPFAVVLSDLAPHTTGIRSVDQARAVSLIEDALDLALKVLRPEGRFVTKIFDGPDVKDLQKTLQNQFSKVQVLRPQATRSHSKEIYLIASGWQGPKVDTLDPENQES